MHPVDIHIQNFGRIYKTIAIMEIFIPKRFDVSDIFYGRKNVRLHGR